MHVFLRFYFMLSGRIRSAIARDEKIFCLHEPIDSYIHKPINFERSAPPNNLFCSNVRDGDDEVSWTNQYAFCRAC